MSRSIVIIATLTMLAGCVGYALWWAPAVRAPRLLAGARVARQAGNHAEAERLAALAYQLLPGQEDAKLLASESAAAQQEFARAVEHARRISPHDKRLRLRVALLLAEWNHHQLFRLSDAERHYRDALLIDPDHLAANEGLAKLLGLCGRRREAIPFVLRLILQDQPTDLLFLLAREDSGLEDDELLGKARLAVPDDPNVLTGLAWSAANSERTDEAVSLLKQATAIQHDQIAAKIAIGQQLLFASRFHELLRWESELDNNDEDYPEVWLIRGRLAEETSQHSAAIRCYWESLRRGPESKAVCYRIERLLVASGDLAKSKPFAEHLQRLHDLEAVQNRVLFSDLRNQAVSLLELSKAFAQAGRIWEAYGWSLIALQTHPDDDRVRTTVRQRRPTLKGLPLRLTADKFNPAQIVDLGMYPLPRFNRSRSTVPASPSNTPDKPGQTVPLSFRDDAQTTGLNFRYFNGTEGAASHRMFEFTGGGIGVLDYDLDGASDLFFTQGRPWDRSPVSDSGAVSGQYRDRLYRNLSGLRFQDVTTDARIAEAGFGQGVSIGDYNSDGFPDVYVANIGANQLWMNQGDGTLSDVTQQSGLEGHAWTTSCVVADLNCDALPDLYDVNYVASRDVFDRVCRLGNGQPTMCMPFDFDGQADRLWLNDGSGHFTDATTEVLSAVPNGKGLGTAVWSADGSGRLSLMVANDTTPSFFFTPEYQDGRFVRLVERGIESGLALNGDGKPTGSMGIALGDVNGDELLDVFVTNFLGESNTFFASVGSGLYEDQTRQYGLHSTQYEVLGFGTQFIDTDLDGRLELFMANGHIDDLTSIGRPHRMPPLLFRMSPVADAASVGESTSNRSRPTVQFQRVPPTESGPYFQKEWLGRAVARIDWNRDGQEDLVVGHLHDSVALLTNTTQSVGDGLSLKLIGTRSNRDAIGTSIRVRIGKQTIIRQLTAGDGYQACNEHRIIVGVGDARQIDELTVNWPSGFQQRFTTIASQGELILAEGGSLLKSGMYPTP